MKTWRNILRNAARPDYFPVMLNKAVLRVTERNRRRAQEKVHAWIAERAEDAADFARGHDPDLWEEALRAGAAQKAYADARLAALGLDLGGGGHYPLLYFVVRHLQPGTVVETGVAAGFSSRAILIALSENGTGTLWSSDFPYFRFDDPEQYVGYLVEDALQSRWRLMTKGDRTNLPRIRAQCGPIDLVHYDSDKSYAGRAFALRTLAPALTENSVILMDDIQDNAFFMDYVEREGRPHRVFAFEGKYVGMAGPADLLDPAVTHLSRAR